jgi:hypothetical protein
MEKAPASRIGDNFGFHERIVQNGVSIEVNAVRQDGQ